MACPPCQELNVFCFCQPPNLVSFTLIYLPEKWTWNFPLSRPERPFSHSLFFLSFSDLSMTPKVKNAELSGLFAAVVLRRMSEFNLYVAWIGLQLLVDEWFPVIDSTISQVATFALQRLVFLRSQVSLEFSPLPFLFLVILTYFFLFIYYHYDFFSLFFFRHSFSQWKRKRQKTPLNFILVSVFNIHLFFFSSSSYTGATKRRITCRHDSEGELKQQRLRGHSAW